MEIICKGIFKLAKRKKTAYDRFVSA